MKSQSYFTRVPNRIVNRCASWLFTALCLCTLSSTAVAQQFSQLWGQNGEPWNPPTSRLRDFTGVGYMAGNVPIPNWPVGVDVTNFGAIPNDGIDDSQAFIAAIAACPNFHAVFVPSGRYIIGQQIIPTRNHFVLRGESMYGTVLFMPKNLNEIYIQENGYSATLKTTGHPKGFFRVEGGTERSIENLTFEFREQRKMGHWEHKGADAISYSSSSTHSWVRNIHLKNVDHGVMVAGASNISFINIVFNNFIGRHDIDGTSGIKRWAGHIGMSMGNAGRCLYHNIDFGGKYFHTFDIISGTSGSVVSRVRATDMSFGHHGIGANQDLYTDIDLGEGTTLSVSNSQTAETHWGIWSNKTINSAGFSNATGSNHVFVGIDSVYPSANTPTFFYESIDPAQLHPKNIYLAQMEYREKPLPEPPAPSPPSPYLADLIRINPTDDNTTNSSSPDTVPNPGSTGLGVENVYLKFDLTGIPLDAVVRARLRMNALSINNAPFEVAVWSVDNDAWTEDTITFNNRPAAVSLLDTRLVEGRPEDIQLEWDVTGFVQQELLGGNKVVTLTTRKTSGSGFLTSFRSSEDGLAPELIIEKVADPVPGAPSAPAAIRTQGRIGNIVLDWEDSPESDVVTYNVYRSPTFNNGYKEPVATGLVTSDFVDIDSVGNWSPGGMHNDRVFRYKITAVDAAGNESPRSFEALGTTLDSVNTAPAFVSETFFVHGALLARAYNGNLVGKSSDPEGDSLHFYKIEGPAWLTINEDGSLTGTPELGDVGVNQFTVQVNALGGSDEATFQILVDAGSIVPGAPAAPVDLTAESGSGLVLLDWADNGESDLSFYTLYRSTVSGAAGSLLADGLTASRYNDYSVQNGVTYYYTLRAHDTSGKPSLLSRAVAVTPSASMARVIADYSFNLTKASSDTDSATTASNLADGGGFVSGYENRDVGGAHLHGNPKPSLKFSKSALSDGVLLDNDYLSFNVSNIQQNLRPQSLSFDTRSLSPSECFVFTSVGGFATMGAQLVVPTSIKDLGDGKQSQTLWLHDMAQFPAGQNLEIRIYFITTSTLGEPWIDNLRLSVMTDTPSESVLPPVNLTAAPLSGTSVQLAWTDPAASGQITYSVYRTTAPGVYGAALAVGITGISYVDSTAVPGTRYFYTVAAVHAAEGRSGNSAEATAMATAPTPTFLQDPAELPAGFVDAAYSADLSPWVSAPAGVSFTFSKISGPAWISVSSNGAVGGQPTLAEVGENALVVEVSDGSGNSDQATFAIIVSYDSVFNVNDAPVFNSNPISGAGATEVQPYSGSIAGSATDADFGDNLTYAKANGPAWLSVGMNGSLSGTPSNSDVGLNSFTVQVSDEAGATGSATLEITVANVNDAPVFSADPILGGTATEGVPYSGTIAGTATDADANDILTYSKTGGPAWLIVASNGTLSGTPSGTAGGMNSFTVLVSDGNGGTDSAALQITVANVNDAPVFGADPIIGANVTEGTPYNGSLAGSASDADGDALSYSKTSGPIWLGVASNGTISGTPSTGDAGLNTFTVGVSDGNGGTDSATLQITVLMATTFTDADPSGNLISTPGNWSNGLPTGGLIGTIAMNAKHDSSVTHTGYQVVHTAGTITKTGLGGLNLGTGTLWKMDGSAAQLSSTRGMNLTGATFTLNQGTANVTENNVDCSLNAASSLFINGGTMSIGRSLIFNGGNLTVTGGTLSMSANLGSSNINSGGNANLNGGTVTAGNLTFGTNAFNVRFGGTTASTLTIANFGGGRAKANLIDINFAPGTLASMRLTNPVESGVSGVDGELGWSKVGSETGLPWAQALWSDGRLTYNGQSFTTLGSWATVTSSGFGDGYLFAYNSATATLSLVEVPNRNPVFTANPFAAAAATEDAAYTGSIAGIASDPDLDPLTYSLVDTGVWLSVAANGALSGTPTQANVGTNTFTVRAEDGNGGSATATLTIQVINVNDVPVFSSAVIIGADATEDVAYADSIAESATDEDGDTLSYSKTSGPAWLNVAANGELWGTPENGDVGTNTFTVAVSDGNGGTASATLNITVINVNDAPIFTANPIIGTAADEDVPYTGTIAGSAADEDGDSLTYSKTFGPAWLSVAPNGGLSGTPANGAAGLNSFAVAVSDGNGGTDSTTLNITVEAAESQADFSSWISDPAFAITPGQQGPMDDQDRDGLANIIEAWFGTHPGIANRGISALSSNGAIFQFTHPRNSVDLMGLSAVYEWSPNLRDWYGEGSGPGNGATVQFSTTPLAEGLRVTATPSLPQNRVFIRLVVTNQ